jgi:membrane-bound ClpP family serine protease
MEPWIWPILLLALGLTLAVLEVFFPSAGLLALLSAVALVAAVIQAFRLGPVLGVTMLVAVAVGGPAIVILAFRWWPSTAMGKQVLLDVQREEDVLPDDPQRRQLKGLVGRVGRAKCQMLPGGVIAVDGLTVDAVSEGVPIEMGQAVRVLRVQANRVVVRLVEEAGPTPTSDNVLERPIDSIATDPFAESPPPGLTEGLPPENNNGG